MIGTVFATSTPRSGRRKTHSLRNAPQRGFVALLSVILVAAMLTAAITAASADGMRAAALTERSRSRAQARTLADACATVMLTRMLTEGTPTNGLADGTPVDLTLTTGICHAWPPRQDVARNGTVTVHTSGTASGYSAFVTVTARTQQRCSASSPLPYGIAIDEWTETPEHE